MREGLFHLFTAIAVSALICLCYQQSPYNARDCEESVRTTPPKRAAAGPASTMSLDKVSVVLFARQIHGDRIAFCNA